MTERLERVAEACYEQWVAGTGGFCEPDWARLTTAQRECWRRVVETAWRTE